VCGQELPYGQLVQHRKVLAWREDGFREMIARSAPISVGAAHTHRFGRDPQPNFRAARVSSGSPKPLPTMQMMPVARNIRRARLSSYSTPPSAYLACTRRGWVGRGRGRRREPPPPPVRPAPVRSRISAVKQVPSRPATATRGALSVGLACHHGLGARAFDLLFLVLAHRVTGGSGCGALRYARGLWS